MEDVVAELQPNSKKIVLLSFLKLFGVLALIGGLLYFLSIFVDFSMFEVFLGELNVEINLTAMFIPMLGIIITLVLIVLAIKYFEYSNVSYVFLKEGFKYYESFINKKELFIPYANIVKVWFETIPVLNTGNITIELSGMKEKNVEIKFVDNTQKVASDIMTLINQYKSRYYAQKGEEYKFDSIMDREGF
ncbi:MAG: hypothetical protein ABIC04_08055 [Nanoarchaeota archaeon]